MTHQVVVLGSANADYSMRVASIPEPGETLLGDDFSFALGGKGANQAMACARLGASTAFIASVGDDAAGRLALETYRAAGLDTTHVSTGTLATGSALIFVADNGENSIGVAAGANSELDLETVERCASAIAAADYLLMQLESPLASIEAAARLARASGSRVILNPAPAQPLSEALLAEVDILTPNETELATLTGMPITSTLDMERAATALRQRGVNTVIVTCGPAGALIVSADQIRQITAPMVAALDTTAAGDTFNGALVVALAEGRNLTAAVSFATHAAALSVTRRGAIDAIPTRAEVDAFL